MSGFVGILATDGGSVDPYLLQRLTDALTYFAPDGAAARAIGRVGLGFAESRTTPVAAGRHKPPLPMPTSDDHGTWVVADASLDERERLVRELGTMGVRAEADAPVARLLLAAYRAWGTRCAEHLHGDFAFAIWDDTRARLLLARDRFGTRPLYYARANGAVVYANALDVVRAHPGVSSTLDAAAIGDFLRMGSNTDLEGTAFAQIRCVPPAHILVIDGAQTKATRYWELPTGSALAYRRVDEYAEHFTSVFREAVADRLRGLPAAALLMSGGRDSTAVAALARDVASGGTPRLAATTAVFDYALPDEERSYAAAAGAALDLRVEFVTQDDYGWFEGWERPDLWRPEPVEAPLLAADADFAARAAAQARVALTGDGGDAVLRERESHLARLLLNGQWIRAARETIAYMRLHRRVPRPGFRRIRMRRLGLASAHPPVPPWLRREVIERSGLRDRWAAIERDEARPPTPGLLRPEAYGKLRSGFWTRCFESDHASATGIPLTLRHPFFDERVIEFLLSLPAEQWANDKGIVVAAMRNRLPDRVRLRQKTPLVGDCYELAFAAAGRPRPGADEFNAEAKSFIDPDALFETTPEMDATDSWDWTRAYSFALWLRRLETGRAFHRAPAAPAALKVGL
jgi:asparagine synthase (glutamine-hydrolysing)